jgi:hypothetical protein
VHILLQNKLNDQDMMAQKPKGLRGGGRGDGFKEGRKRTKHEHSCNVQIHKDKERKS